ncbi:conjugation system SOS inhibitor PsiB [Kosakonia sacchari]|uniref:conjugation system SOS inhibitor PsiB n=1 Tax=Kosakonia sacchari TaxID=1158459 RepID=UPI001585A597|nr:conjugation system SOS inhibitor PsiB [Kosakonia sacchari]NUL39821.1 conjugation system SOS inhibitor PsiB [Kosakonia sacchari]
MKKYTLAALNGMFPADLESVRESGDEERRQLSDSVTSLVALPAGWRVNAEYRGEFGGQFPVQLRYAPDGDSNWFLCLCSPGEMLPSWTLFLLARDARLIRILHQSAALCPDVIGGLLAQVAGMHRFNCSSGTISELLNAEVVS